MSRLLFVSIFLLFHANLARSLLPNAIREFIGIDSKTNRFVLPVTSNNTAPNPLANVSQACQKAVIGLASNPLVAAKCE